MDSIRHSEPSDVAAELSEVIQSGPGGVEVSFEPDAAIETGHRLIEKGMKAERGETDATR